MWLCIGDGKLVAGRYGGAGPSGRGLRGPVGEPDGGLSIPGGGGKIIGEPEARSGRVMGPEFRPGLTDVGALTGPCGGGNLLCVSAVGDAAPIGADGSKGA